MNAEQGSKAHSRNKEERLIPENGLKDLGWPSVAQIAEDATVRGALKESWGKKYKSPLQKDLQKSPQTFSVTHLLD